MTKFRYLVLSDIHSNLYALQAVLADAGKYGPFDMCLNAGDVVGYGPYPNECIETVEERGFVSVQGNHDRAVMYNEPYTFNPRAAIAVRHNHGKLTRTSYAFLRTLKNTPYVNPENSFAMVHGSFFGSYENMYVFYEPDARMAMTYLHSKLPDGKIKQLRLGIIGHTHIPMHASCWTNPAEDALGGPEGLDFHAYEINPGSPGVAQQAIVIDTKDRDSWVKKVLFNPGSVGQPRNRDTHAAWGIVEIDSNQITLHFKQTEYDIAATQEKMREEGLPESLITRLALGR